MRTPISVNRVVPISTPISVPHIQVGNAIGIHDEPYHPRLNRSKAKNDSPTRLPCTARNPGLQGFDLPRPFEQVCRCIQEALVSKLVQYPPAIRLPRNYDDLESLCEVRRAAQPGPYHKGEWTGIALHSMGGLWHLISTQV